jgi:hypothetical protein
VKVEVRQGFGSILTERSALSALSANFRPLPHPSSEANALGIVALGRARETREQALVWGYESMEAASEQLSLDEFSSSAQAAKEAKLNEHEKIHVISKSVQPQLLRLVDHFVSLPPCDNFILSKLMTLAIAEACKRRADD